MKLKLLLTMLINLLLLIYPVTSLANKHGITNGKEVSLGWGFSTERDKQTRYLCLNAAEPHSARRDKAYTYLDRRWRLSQLKTHFGLNAQVNINGIFFRESLKTKFTFDSVENEYSELFTFHTRLELFDKTHMPQLIDGSYFNDLGQDHLDKPELFKNTCGDKYTIFKQEGAELFLQAQLHFYNRKDKAFFESRYNLDVFPFADIAAKLQASYEYFLDQGVLTIVALQLGGDATRLNEIFLADPNEPIPAIDCKFDNLEACKILIKNLLVYARDKFPTQIRDPNNHDKLYTHKFELEKYTALNGGNDPSAPPIVTPQVKAARKKLAQTYEATMDDINKAAVLLKTIYSKEHLAKLEKALETLEQNKNLAFDAGKICFENLDICEEEAKRALEAIKDIDRNLLDIKREVWTVEYSPVNGRDPQCKSHWTYNSSEGNIDLFQVNAQCTSAKLIGIGRMLKTDSRFVIVTDTAWGEEYFYGAHNGHAIDGKYVAARRETSGNLHRPITRKVMGSIVTDNS